MYCQNRIVYTVQEGDSLYRLARQYDTTVTELILGNPGINPYNLQIGMRLHICPGAGYDGPIPDLDETNPNRPNMNRPGMPNMPEMPNMSGMPNAPVGNETTPNERENMVENLMRAMRLAWLDLIYWTRMYVMSVNAASGDQQELEERVRQAADEITDVFAEYLPIAATRQLRNLLTEHVELTGDLIRTQKEGNTENYDAIIKEWYGNANQLAELLGDINPYFGGRQTRNMLLNYLDMTRESIEQQLKGDYGISIDTFRDLKNQVLEMADYFSRGLLAR